MPQVSLYIDSAVYTELKSAAKRKDRSLSSFVNDILKKHLDDELPEEFFESIGSFKEDPLEVPEELPRSFNLHRPESESRRDHNPL
jgi:hypothetical protein